MVTIIDVISKIENDVKMKFANRFFDDFKQLLLG